MKSPFERVWNWRNRKKVREFVILPSGKRLHSYGKSPCLMGKSTINGPFPSSLFWHNQRVSCLSSCFPVKKMLSCHCRGPFFPISRPSGSALVQGSARWARLGRSPSNPSVDLGIWHPGPAGPLRETTGGKGYAEFLRKWWLVGGAISPSWKMMEFVNGKDYPIYCGK